MISLDNPQDQGFAQESLKSVENVEMKVYTLQENGEASFEEINSPTSNREQASINDRDKEKMPETSNSTFNTDAIASMSDQEIEEFRDDRGFNILMLAAEAGRLSIVQSIIDAGDDVDFEAEGETAVNLAYKGGHNEVVLALLRANSKFPENIQRETASDELKEFLELNTKMHERVGEANENDLEQLKDYLKLNVESNQSLKYFYDPVNNFSLLKFAILSKKFLIYEFLIFLNIFLAPHESMDEINEQLTDDERETLSDINFRISPNLMTETMMILMRNCKLSPDSPKERQGEFMGFIREAFDSLFMIPLIAIVLKIVAASRNFKIVFDFKRDSVTFLDPSSEPYCNGLMYLSGKIYVGAKDLLNVEAAKNVTAVIAHELTHYAMFLVYENWAKPYKKKDQETEARFNAISDECERLKDYEEIVGLVYDCYDEDMWHAELIVRVPHMIAAYFNNIEVLNSLRETFRNLFDFYEQTCVPEMEAELPRIEERFCPVKQVEKKVKKQKRWIFFLVIFIVIGSIFSGLGLYWFYNPTISWSDLTENEQNFIKNSTVEFYGAEVKFGKLLANDSKVFDLLSSEQLKSGLEGISKELSKALNLTLHPYVFLTWSNMTQSLKESFLTRKVDFQEQKVSIGKITKNDSTLNLLSSSQIREIFTESFFKISSKVDRKVKIYIERFFAKESIEIVSEQFIRMGGLCGWSCAEIYKNGKVDLENTDVTTFDKITQSIETSKFFLLSSAAGDGKSTTFRHFSHKLKENFPQKWIQFVDLKKHFEAFQIGKALKLNNFQVLTKFLGEKVLALESFELEIFKELFVAGDVIFLWDGVDEISPNFKNFMLDLVEKVSKSGNFQFISTRPQHSKDFQKSFKVEAHKLIPFSELDRYEFLVKTIADKKFNKDGTEVFEKLKRFYNQTFENMKETLKDTQFSKYFEPILKASKIFQNIDEQESSKEDKSVDRFESNPLLISMISEISCDENFKIKNSSFDSYQLYQIFIDKKLEVVDEKGKIAQKEKNRRTRKIDIWQVHQIFALKLLFRKSGWFEVYVSTFKFDFLQVKLEEISKQFSSEQISRFGILQVNSIRKDEDGNVEYDFNFAHRTFAEFFVAEFFLDFLSLDDVDLNIKKNHWKVMALAKILVQDPQTYPVENSFMLDASKLDDFKPNFFKFWADVESKNSLIDEKFRQIFKASQFVNFFNMQKSAVFKGYENQVKFCPNFFDENGKKSFDLTQIKEALGRDSVRTLLNFKGLGYVGSLFFCSVKDNHPEIFSQLLTDSRRLLNETEIISSLIDPENRENVLYRSIYQGMHFTKIFIGFIENSLSKDSQKKILAREIRFSLTALQFSALEYGGIHLDYHPVDPKIFDYLKETYEKIFTNEEIRKQFLSNEFVTKWLKNEKNERNFEYLRELFETDDLTSIGFKGNGKDFREIVFPFDSIERYCSDAKNVLNDDQLKKILSFNDENFWTFLQESVFSNDFSSFEFLKEIYEKFFTEEEIKESFLVKKMPNVERGWSIDGSRNEVLSFFDFAFRERWRSFSEQAIKPLSAYLQKLFETKDLRKIGLTIDDDFFFEILNKYSDGEHYTYEDDEVSFVGQSINGVNFVEDVNFVWNLISEFLSEDELKKLLQYETEDNRNALKASLEKEDEKLFQSVKSIYEKFFTQDEMKEFL